MQSIGMEHFHHVLVNMFIEFLQKSLVFTVVSSAHKTENELSNHTLTENPYDEDELNEQTDLVNITYVETEAKEDIKRKHITNDIEEDKLSNETQEKRFTVKTYF